MPDKRPRKCLKPSAYREAQMNWSWGGAIIGALLPVGLKMARDRGIDELGTGWGIAAMIMCVVGYFAGSLIFESAFYTNDD